MIATEELRVGIVQTDIYWEDISSNLAHLEEKMASLHGKLDILVLPEMFATGFSPKAFHLAQTMNGEIHKWMMLMAKKLNSAIVGSALIKENGLYYNRLLWVEPSAKTEIYDKKYLFSYSGEDKWLTAGNQRKIIQWKGWAIKVCICYDLRFPTWSWQEENKIQDVLIYVASWPEKRSDAWKTLLKARAIENQCYVVGVNRVGTDGLGNKYNGLSSIYAYNGKNKNEIEQKETLQIVTLDKEELEKFRGRYPFFQDDFK